MTTPTAEAEETHVLPDGRVAVLIEDNHWWSAVLDGHQTYQWHPTRELLTEQLDLTPPRDALPERFDPV